MMPTATRHIIAPTSLGALTLVASGPALTGVYFPGHWYKPRAATFGPRVAAPNDPLLANAGYQIQQYLAGERAAFDLPTATHGDAFQERVWAALREIPYGETITYGELAKSLGDGVLPHEVGQAVGRNPLSIIVPCHRVVGKHGKLTGYAGGLERKRALLELEGRAEEASDYPEPRRLAQEALPLCMASGQ